MSRVGRVIIIGSDGIRCKTYADSTIFSRCKKLCLRKSRKGDCRLSESSLRCAHIQLHNLFSGYISGVLYIKSKFEFSAFIVDNFFNKQFVIRGNDLSKGIL